MTKKEIFEFSLNSDYEFKEVFNLIYSIKPSFIYDNTLNVIELFISVCNHYGYIKQHTVGKILNNKYIIKICKLSSQLPAIMMTRKKFGIYVKYFISYSINRNKKVIEFIKELTLKKYISCMSYLIFSNTLSLTLNRLLDISDKHNLSLYETISKFERGKNNDL